MSHGGGGGRGIMPGLSRGQFAKSCELYDGAILSLDCASMQFQYRGLCGCLCLYVGLSIYVCLSLSLYVYDRPPIVAGVVEDRELIEVRKIPNRYGVAVGTRLYRLRVLPMDGDQLEVTRPDL